MTTPEARKLAREKYKKSEKGHATYLRWCANPKKKEIDKKGMQKPTAKAKAVIRSMRALSNNPDLQEKKRIRDIEYGKSEKGRIVNLEAAARYRATEKGSLTRKATKAARRSTEGRFTTGELKECFALHGNKCAHCGATDHLTADHIIPLKLGGDNYITNIQPLCKSCNSRKGARHVG
jgi:5-methylcytosine-specific restriction endonuclease McrA